MEVTIAVTGEVKLRYEEDSPEFKEALESYNELISDGDADDMIRYVASQLQAWGDHEHMVEGVGYVGLIGGPVPTENYSGIQVDPSYCDFDYD